MPTFERVVDGRVAERRHVPYRSRDLAALERSPAWRKVSETYAPATSAEPRPTVEEQRRARAALAAKKPEAEGGGG